ncbi:MAG: prepilin-type N-terminal cleavage/methylation domain-containing protein [Opitutus sp.]|nr:prepilin-type N-terminal cleavage/methylation domain-containing protein [Opitutus sp.]MCS6274334.1 prepilin-type N-terminal cleavage/methylation domain-containing protein [Opitutus sp.]MCS6278708.1 prepilin-type N-terminal cleavage/methylation domain-containing protein [Opitutus sp.]MCS6299713.1 prepilin-type N-terminal cleavage/methylation domain-containing protein [Opitutus sp.]
MNKYSRSGFTLIELLTVIAIIGILAAIIIPAAGGVKTSANKAKTKAMFSQWSLAMDLFKSDYGYYPAIGSTTPTGSSTKLVVATSFFAALTGKDYLGTAITPAANLYGNTRKLSFYSPASADVDSTGKLVDAFGNTEFAVFTDTNGDGIINNVTPSGGVADSPVLSLQAVKNIDGVSILPTISANFDPAVGVRAGVIFYSAGKGTNEKDIVTSW